MADYIRGKKAYTKWDVDADNVDMDIPPDGQQPHIQTSPPGWFSGTKGKVLKVLFLIFLFLIGLIFGYLLRRGVLEVELQKGKAKCSFPSGVYAYKDKYSHILQEMIDPQNIHIFLRNFTSEVHRSGTESARKIAHQIEEYWKDFGLSSVRIEKYNILLSLPSRDTPNKVQLINNADLWFSASESGDGALYPEMRPYCAYSPNGTAKGKLVYAHYGRKEDFDYLEGKNVSVQGAVVIMRNGKLHRGSKVKMAEQLGAVAVLLYPDPADVVPLGSQTFPLGLGLPGDGVVRGSVKTSLGDPQTPLLPSTDDMYRLPMNKLNLIKIPVQPVSYNDANELLRGLGGPAAPAEWKGGLNIMYNLGPGYASPNDTNLVKVTVANELQSRDIYNVLGTIPGQFEPGRYIIIGGHHDSWTNGSSDPGTGTAVLMELARVFGQLLKKGWKPDRTIILASWDAEEFGISGSTEWVEEHSKELSHRAIAYINIDAAITGSHSLQVLGSPLLRQAIQEATSVVPFHDKTYANFSVFDMWKKRMPREPNTFSSEPEIQIPGSGSDFVGFMTGIGVSSIHLQFVNKDMISDYPLYHTAYDVFDAIANFTDPHFAVSKTMVAVIGILAMKLSDSLHLPLRASHYSAQVKLDFASFSKTYSHLLKEHGVDIEPFEKAVDAFDAACIAFHNNFETVDKHNLLLALREYNDRLLELERAFLLPNAAVSPNLHYRHVIYGPHFKNSYKGVAFPHLLAAIETARNTKQNAYWEGVKLQMSYVIHGLRSAVGVLKSEVLSGHRLDL